MHDNHNPQTLDAYNITISLQTIQGPHYLSGQETKNHWEHIVAAVAWCEESGGSAGDISDAVLGAGVNLAGACSQMDTPTPIG